MASLPTSHTRFLPPEGFDSMLTVWSCRAAVFGVFSMPTGAGSKPGLSMGSLPNLLSWPVPWHSREDPDSSVELPISCPTEEAPGGAALRGGLHTCGAPQHGCPALLALHLLASLASPGHPCPRLMEQAGLDHHPHPSCLSHCAVTPAHQKHKEKEKSCFIVFASSHGVNIPTRADGTCHGTTSSQD